MNIISGSLHSYSTSPQNPKEVPSPSLINPSQNFSPKRKYGKVIFYVLELS